jgi:hypothetical protein
MSLNTVYRLTENANVTTPAMGLSLRDAILEHTDGLKIEAQRQGETYVHGSALMDFCAHLTTTPNPSHSMVIIILLGIQSYQVTGRSLSHMIDLFKYALKSIEVVHIPGCKIDCKLIMIV